MGVEAVQKVMTVLPDRFDDDEGRIRRNRAEDLHAALLTIDKAVLFCGIAGMASPSLKSFGANGGHDGLFGARLGGPASLIGSQSQIAVSDQDDGFGHFHILACGIVGR